MPLRYLITGATGFIGGHVAEACVGRGSPVYALVRPTSDCSLLQRPGVTVFVGELTDAALVRKALENADVVVHCAGKVGDKGPVEEYRAVNVEALRGLLEACKSRPLHRFIHLSSLGVYEARHHHGTTETEPLPAQHIDGYTTTKVEADLLAQEYASQHQVPVVVLRPGFVYGPRDRIVLPRLIERLRAGKVHHLGAGQRAMNCIFIGNLVDAIFLAVDRPEAVGQVYNLTDGEPVSKLRFLGAIASGLGLPAAKNRLPQWLGNLVVRLLQRRLRRAGPSGWAPITQAQFKFMFLNLDFNIDKARRELGYTPRFSFEQGMKETLAWYRANP